MNITNENKVRIYRNEKEGRVFYSIGLSKKKEDGTYENGYMSCQFRKDVELEDKTDIYIKNAWLTFYKQDKKTIPYIFINEFKTIEQKVEELKKDTNVKNIEFTEQDLSMFDKIEDNENMELPF